MSENWNISELISLELFSKIRDAFSKLTQMYIYVSDVEGNDLTNDIGFIDLTDKKYYLVPIELEKEPIGWIVGEKPEISDFEKEALRDAAEILTKLVNERVSFYHTKEEVERAASMKTDFLANMSHEIRTPMNAVIGMAEMALREDLPPNAKDYINQIKSSGRSLLNIINDILDYSKIDSGKMDVIPVEYEPLSLFNDVANIVMTRLRDKDVQLLLDIDPNFPRKLLGDNMRVRQILINIANNAVKFTKRGRVKIQIGFNKLDDRKASITFSVKDTGIGIKEADLKKLFQSFQQVDSKRNRNVEGTGLGLAISKRLVEMMGGSIGVTSEYGKGSEFYFNVIQDVLDWSPAIVVKNSENIAAIGYWQNKYLARQFYQDAKELGVHASTLLATGYFDDVMEDNDYYGKEVYLFFEQEKYSERIERILSQTPNITGVMLIGFFDEAKPPLPNVRVFRQPLSSVSVAMALNNEEFHSLLDEKEAFEFDFTAPDAEVLLVDDNAINLTVAEGLLEPLKMKVFTAPSGKDAIDMISRKHFDLIFMDHMMPELDGVETTRIIRRLHPEYSDVPIIALTANAMEGTKEMFLSEGMNDFVAKPIEVRTIVSKVKQWLPVEKILKGRTVVDNNPQFDEKIVVGDLDTNTARKLLGNDKLFWSILKEYYKNINAKTKLIKSLELDKDWPAYTIEVHALKSASKQIGAMELSSMAAELEMAGNARDSEFIRANTNKMLDRYQGYIPVLAPFCEEKKVDEGTKSAASNDELTVLFEEMAEAVDNLDMDAMEEVMTKLEKFKYDGEQAELAEKLREAVDSIDVDTCTELLDSWKNLL